MKPLTKEEFLDKKNAEIHRELLSVFNQKETNKILSNYWIESTKDPSYFICDIKQTDNPLRREVTYGYQAIFIDLIEMIKSGELVFKNKESPTN